MHSQQAATQKKTSRAKLQYQNCSENAHRHRCTAQSEYKAFTLFFRARFSLEKGRSWGGWGGGESDEQKRQKDGKVRASSGTEREGESTSTQTYAVFAHLKGVICISKHLPFFSASRR